MSSGSYAHTQKGIIRACLLIAAGVCLVGAWANWSQVLPLSILLVVAAVCLLLAFCFAHLTVAEEGGRLAVRFGPIPLFQKSIPLDAVTGVTKRRSSLLAGWGIHWTPRGWLWNVGGFDCVEIEMGRKHTLIGTDEPDALVAFLRKRTGLDAPQPTTRAPQQ